MKKNDDFWEVLCGIIMLICFSFILFIIKHWIYFVMIIILFLLCIVLYKIIDLKTNFHLKKYYVGNNNSNWLRQLEKDYEKNKDKINMLKSGIYGENNMIFVLENSGISMYIMSDLKIKYDDKIIQIDTVAVTKRKIYFLESKNIKANVDIYEDGKLIRKYNKYKKGFKNPITQNEEHEQLIDIIFKREKINFKYQSLVVLTNNDSLVNYKRNADKIRDKIIRVDELIRYIKRKEKFLLFFRTEKQVKKICDVLLKYKIEDKTDEYLVEKLKQYRRRQMIIQNINGYQVFKDITIEELISKKPKSTEELYKINGLNDFTINKYGEDIIKIINE